MIIGRKREQEMLEKAFQSKEAEFITIYGRRRVGKTYLIRQFFGLKPCKFFHLTGIQDGAKEVQLQAFGMAFTDAFIKEEFPLKTPSSWLEAFRFLHKAVLKEKDKVIIFFDEVPWLATRKSGFLQALAFFWNQYWSSMPHVILIVCGSSASWLIKKIIYDKGGLHNRTTIEMRLLPFDLGESRDYLKSRSVNLSDDHVLSLYMALGGIPYYLRLVEKGLSAQENIQRLFFDENAPLQDEFTKLFNSLFEHAESYKELIVIISQKREGMTRAELQTKARLSVGGGTLTKRLDDLQATGFIRPYTPYDRSRGEFYVVIDEYCLFYLKWVVSFKNEEGLKNFWMIASQRLAYYAWAGYAFEAVCLKHRNQIMQALQISTAVSVGPWRYVPLKPNANGAQIDLVIDRTDDTITLAEIKYIEQPFSIDKDYAHRLLQKMETFKKETKTRKHIFMVMIAAHGILPNMYSDELLSKIVELEDLFKAP